MGTKAQVSSSGKPAPCIARQPILTASEAVIGYELFFRESAQQHNFTSGDGEKATSAAIDMLNVMGLDVLCNGRLAFINCTRQTLLSDYFALLPPGSVVIEIQHTVPPEEDVIRACQRLKHPGYSIALDNFEPDDKRVSLVPYADYIKVDITKIAPGPSALLVTAHGNDRCRMLAHKVETRERFCKPVRVASLRFRDIFFNVPSACKSEKFPPTKPLTCVY
jgi:c-di-GMP-related signal transduction protein